MFISNPKSPVCGLSCVLWALPVGKGVLLQIVSPGHQVCLYHHLLLAWKYYGLNLSMSRLTDHVLPSVSVHSVPKAHWWLIPSTGLALPLMCHTSTILCMKTLSHHLACAAGSLSFSSMLCSTWQLDCIQWEIPIWYLWICPYKISVWQILTGKTHTSLQHMRSTWMWMQQDGFESWSSHSVIWWWIVGPVFHWMLGLSCWLWLWMAFCQIVVPSRQACLSVWLLV